MEINDARAGGDVTILSKSPYKMGGGGTTIMTVFFQVTAFHHQSFLPAIVTFPTVIHNGPCNSVADLKRLISGIVGHPFPQLRNFTNNFMTKDDGGGGSPFPQPGMEVRTADRTTGD